MTVKEYLKTLHRDCTTAEQVVEFISETAIEDPDFLRGVLREAPHDYIIDGASRGFMTATINLGNSIVLDAGGGIRYKKGTKEDVAYTSRKVEKIIKEIMEDMYIREDDRGDQ